MQDLAPVRVAHRVQYLDEQPDARWHIERAGIAPGHQRLALHVLHRDVGHASGIDAGIVKAGDVRGFERGEDAAFTREAFRHLGRHAAQWGIFSATWRSNAPSARLASHTSAMPPAPSGRSSS